MTGRWITDWNPDDEEFWARTGKRIARRNLVFSIFAEHFGFAIWVLWSVVVLNLGDAGLEMTLPETFWLTAVPNLVGATLRIPYTFAVPRFGGRLWTTISAALLLIPAVLVAVVVPSGWLAAQPHDTQFWILLACAATAGFGGGNFSSSMANISFFYPERRKGFALGLNAAGGNLGVAVVQLVVPIVVSIGLAFAGLVWIPFIVAAAVCAWLFMDSLTQARADVRSYGRALRHGQTWLMSLLYIGTFGSFIGYSFALPLVIKSTFPEINAAVGFLGALIGSLARPFGGWLSDRWSGARVTLGCFIAMGVATMLAIAGIDTHSFGLFFGSFMVIFLLSGAGNGSTYRMIPVIFGELGRKEAAERGLDRADTAVRYRREAAAVIGIAGAIGAFGGFLIQVVFRQASLGGGTDWATSAMWVFLASYVVFAFLTWFYYLRRSFARVPNLAYAEV